MKRQAQPRLSGEGQDALERYWQALQQSENISPVTLHNSPSDLRQFIIWCEDGWLKRQEERAFTPQTVASAHLALNQYLETLLPEELSLFPSEKTHCVLVGRAMGHLATKYATQVPDLSFHELRYRFGYRVAEVVPLHRLAHQRRNISWRSTYIPSHL